MSDSFSALCILRFFDVIVRTRHSFCIAIRKLRRRRPEVLCKNGGTFSGKPTWWGPPFIQVPNKNLELCQRSTPPEECFCLFLEILRTAILEIP